MRKIAAVKNDHPKIKRAMICEDTESGVYLFTYTSLQDGPSTSDAWYATTAEAEEACLSQFGIAADNWETIDDYLEGCQQDWIAPVRVKGQDVGNPQWGMFERLENGIWREVILETKSPNT